MAFGKTQGHPGRHEGWLGLPPAARAAIVVGGFAVAAAVLWALGLSARAAGVGTVQSNVDTYLRVANGELSLSDPGVFRWWLDLVGFLLLTLAVLVVDGGTGLAVCILASVRSEYPPGRDKVSWVAGLWAAFLVVQLPTGIPSALVYWWFISRPARRLAIAETPVCSPGTSSHGTGTVA